MNNARKEPYGTWHPAPWRSFHVWVLWLSSIWIVLFGSLSLWSSWLAQSRGVGVQNVGGLFVILLGVGLFLRLRAVIWIVSVCSMLFGAYLMVGQMSQLMFGTSLLQPDFICFAGIVFLYGILLMRGLLQRK